MTEKVASLSGGLVLGMAFALFLSVGSSRTITSQIHLEYPSMASLISDNDLQSYQTSSSLPASDSTPAFSVPPPAQGQDQGRIIRIASSTETTDPVFDTRSGVVQENLIPKNWGAVTSPKTGSALQQVYLQHTIMAETSQTSFFITAGQAARQASNFTAIADNGSGGGQTTGGSGGEPSIVDSKPQTSGGPAIAHGNPGVEGGEEGPGEPAAAGLTPRPPAPDTISNNSINHHVDPYNPHPEFNNHETEDGDHNDPGAQGGPSQFQGGHRPETD